MAVFLLEAPRENQSTCLPIPAPGGYLQFLAHAASFNFKLSKPITPTSTSTPKSPSLALLFRLLHPRPLVMALGLLRESRIISLSQDP